MMQISNLLFCGSLIASYVVGVLFGFLFTRDYRKSLEEEYNKKHSEIYNTIRKETKDEWSKGWDAAYHRVGVTQKAYHLWFREHGYELKEIDDWLEKYMNKP